MSESIYERLTAKFPIFGLALNQGRYKRYNWGLALAMFIPLIQFGLVLYYADTDFSNGIFHVWYYRIYFRVTLFFLVSLVALLIGTGMYRDMMSDDTIVYVMTKPIKRERIYFEMYSAYLVISFLVVTPGLIAYHIFGDILIREYDSEFSITIFESSVNLLLELFGAYIILIGLGAVFVTTGLGLKRPLLINLLIAFGIIIQQFLLDLIADQFEPVYIAQSIVANWILGFDSNLEVTNALLRFGVGPGIEMIELLINFVLILIITLISGYYVSKRKQIE